MKVSSSDRTIIGPADRVADPPSEVHRSPTQSLSRLVRVSPGVSWYGKILIVGALILALGWELLHLVMILMTLD